MIFNINGKIYQTQRQIRDISKEVIVSLPVYEIKKDIEPLKEKETDKDVVIA